MPIQKFIEKRRLLDLVDEVIRVSIEGAGLLARKLARERGMLARISSVITGGTAIEVAKKKESEDKMIVVILPDTGERGISTWLFNETR